MAKATLNDILLWLVLVSLWGSSYTVIKLGVATVPPALLVTGRLWIGAIVIYAVLKLNRMRFSRRWEDWLHFTVSGLLGNAIPFLLISYGEQSVDSALASIFMGIAPVTTVFMAAIVFPDEALTPRVIIGLFTGIAGVFTLVGPGALSGIGQDLPSQAAILGAALCYSMTTIYVRRFARRPALEMAAGSMIVAALSLTALAFALGGQPGGIEPTATSLGAILYLGLLSTALANLIYFHLVPRLGAARMSQVNFGVPVVGACLGIFVLAEPMTSQRLIALVVISTAVLLVTWRPRSS